MYFNYQICIYVTSQSFLPLFVRRFSLSSVFYEIGSHSGSANNAIGKYWVRTERKEWRRWAHTGFNFIYLTLPCLSIFSRESQLKSNNNALRTCNNGNARTAHLITLQIFFSFARELRVQCSFLSAASVFRSRSQCAVRRPPWNDSREESSADESCVSCLSSPRSQPRES